MTPNKLLRSCTLLLPFLLLWSGSQIASTQAQQVLNLSTRMLVGTGDQVAIAGFILKGPPGEEKDIIIRALGPSLSQFFIPNLLPDPRLDLFGPSGGFLLFNSTCGCPINPPGPLGATEAAMWVSLFTGNSVNYTAMVRGEGSGSLTGLALVEVYDQSPTVGKLANISTRAFVGTGEQIVIAGFIIGNGSGFDNIVARGMGPSLEQFDLTPFLADPTLELRDSNGTPLAANNDWQPDPRIPVNLEPMFPKEAALAATLPTGQYTALLAGLNNTTGIGLVEVYDLGP